MLRVTIYSVNSHENEIDGILLNTSVGKIKKCLVLKQFEGSLKVFI